MTDPNKKEHRSMSDALDEQDPRPPARPFTQFALEQRRGAMHEELTDALADTVAAVLEHGKVGEIKLLLRIKPAGDGMVQILDGLTVKAPQGEKAPSIFFVDERGSVHRSDPRQTELPIRAAGKAIAS